MLRAMCRIYAYTVVALCLMFMTFACQIYLHGLFLQLGMTDLDIPPAFLDYVAELPIFTKVWVVVGVLVVGAIHWWFGVRRDRQRYQDPRGGAIRAFFLAVFAGLFAMRVLYAVLFIVRNVAELSQPTIPMAGPTAVALAWLAGFVLILIEWGWRQEFDELGNKVALCIALIFQWTLVVLGIWAIAEAFQSYLQAVIEPLPACSPAFDVVAQLFAFFARNSNACADAPSWVGATLTMVVALAAFGLASWWCRLYRNIWLGNLDAIIGAFLTGITLVLSSVLGMRLALDLATHEPYAVFLRSLLSASRSALISPYPFVGPLVAGSTFLGIYIRRELSRRAVEDDSSLPEEGFEYAIVTLAFSVAVVFFYGASMFVGDVFVALLHRFARLQANVATADWNFALMLLIPGVIGIFLLLRHLRRISEKARKLTIPTQVYVNSFSIGTSIAAGVSAAVTAYLVVTTLIGAPADPTGAIALRVFAVTLVTAPFAYYYYRVKRDL